MEEAYVQLSKILQTDSLPYIPRYKYALLLKELDPRAWGGPLFSFLRIVVAVNYDKLVKWTLREFQERGAYFLRPQKFLLTEVILEIIPYVKSPYLGYLLPYIPLNYLQEDPDFLFDALVLKVEVARQIQGYDPSEWNEEELRRRVEILEIFINKGLSISENPFWEDLTPTINKYRKT